MAARLNRMHSEQCRMKIQASVIIDRFTKHVKGELELTSTQIAAGTALLDRSVPKLSQIQHVGELQHIHVNELNDAELANIAAGRSNRIAQKTPSAQESAPVH